MWGWMYYTNPAPATGHPKAQPIVFQSHVKSETWMRLASTYKERILLETSMDLLKNKYCQTNVTVCFFFGQSNWIKEPREYYTLVYQNFIWHLINSQKHIPFSWFLEAKEAVWGVLSCNVGSLENCARMGCAFPFTQFLKATLATKQYSLKLPQEQRPCAIWNSPE